MTRDLLPVFLSAVEDRVNQCNWDAIMYIPKDINQPSVGLKSLLTEYGQIKKEKVITHARSYMLTNTRAAQDAHALYKALACSLKDDAKRILVNKKRECVFGVRMSGPIYLKLIIDEATNTNQATTSLIRIELTRLDERMKTYESNVKLFDTFVRDCI